ncbi:MAG: acyl-CoA thioesterase [Flavobacteriales bacterium]|nr:acyl-CoA thioesterase [Flavobacteriales bacterium]|tara:strand:+ start:10530 stop:10883 length:354 start_codon:yes stop_codon:yes gene_type:complete
MEFRTRKLIKPEDLNAGKTLFGGQLLKWIDEEAAIYAMCQLNNRKVTTKFMSEINFISPALLGDVIEIGIETIKVGITSITFKCEARVKDSEKAIIKIDKIVFVNLDDKGRPKPHNK